VVEIAVDFDSAALENTGKTMSPEELRALIESDTEALRLASTGAADLCAARCRQIATKVQRPTMVTELSILNLYPNPADAETVLQTIETVAGVNPIVKRALKWLQPGAPGLDIGDARTRSLLTLPIEAGGIGLSQELAGPLLGAADHEPEISGADVSTAYPFGVE
jgi:hypothetical protein